MISEADGAKQVLDGPVERRWRLLTAAFFGLWVVLAGVAGIVNLLHGNAEGLLGVLVALPFLAVVDFLMRFVRITVTPATVRVVRSRTVLRRRRAEEVTCAELAGYRAWHDRTSTTVRLIRPSGEQAGSTVRLLAVTTKDRVTLYDLVAVLPAVGIPLLKEAVDGQPPTAVDQPT